jgi:hypothetical protein
MSTRGPRRKQMHRWCRPPHDKDQRTPGFRSGTHPRPQRWRLLSGNDLVKNSNIYQNKEVPLRQNRRTKKLYPLDQNYF